MIVLSNEICGSHYILSFVVALFFGWLNLGTKYCICDNSCTKPKQNKTLIY